MRIMVMGAGAVGGYYGAVLSRAGMDVTFIARGEALAAIRGSEACASRASRRAASWSVRRRSSGRRRPKTPTWYSSA